MFFLTITLTIFIMQGLVTNTTLFKIIYAMTLDLYSGSSRECIGHPQDAKKVSVTGGG